jgi:inhibitor of Bruton tyrosine kinase
MIICTESGHVYVRSRTASIGQPSKSFKFQRIPFLQHVAAVCANNAGSFGALKVEYKPLPVNVVGNRLSQDLSQILCFPDCPWPSIHSERTRSINSEIFLSDHRDELGDESIQSDLQDLFKMFDALRQERAFGKTLDIEELCKHHKQKYGADLTVVLQQGAAIPVHRIVLAARSPAIQDMFISAGAIKDSSGLTIRYVPSKNSSTSFDKLQIKDCHLLSMLIFLDYLYTDKLLAVWDSRLAIPSSSLMEDYGVSAGQVRSELQALARALRLPPLVTALGFSSKYVPQPSLQADFRRLYEDCSRHIQWDVDSYKRFNVFAPDVILNLSDKEVFCHSVILRARSPFFAALFTQPEWTQLRWRPDGTISVEFRHLRWNVMSYVLRFIYYGTEGEMFDDLVDFVDSGDGVIEFMFDVLAAAVIQVYDPFISASDHNIRMSYYFSGWCWSVPISSCNLRPSATSVMYSQTPLTFKRPH